MRFEKTLSIDVAESKLDAEFWERIDAVTAERVSLPKDSADLANEIKEVDCLLVNFGVNVDSKLIGSAPALKYVGILATAYGKVDIEYCVKKGIVVSNVPGYSTEGVSEFVFGAILEKGRELSRAKKQASEGNYSEEGFLGTEIKGKIFGVLGLGRIGSRVAEIASSFGASVIYHSRERKPALEAKGIRFAELNELFSTSDFLSIHLAQNKETEGFIDGNRLELLKQGAVVINTAPMELFDVNALENRLKKGDIYFILDHSDEMDQADLQRLGKLANCVIYPPIALATFEARAAKQEIFVKNIENFIEGKPSNTVA